MSPMASTTLVSNKAFTGRTLQSRVATPCSRPARKTAVTPQAGFIGSPTNLIMVASTTAFLAAGRFGLAPTANRQATPGLQLLPSKAANSYTSDPGGFTAVDLLGLGTLGHVFGVGLVLGLKYVGAIP